MPRTGWLLRTDPGGGWSAGAATTHPLPVPATLPWRRTRCSVCGCGQRVRLRAKDQDVTSLVRKRAQAASQKMIAYANAVSSPRPMSPV